MALEKFPTTIAMDIGHVDHNGFVADIFGTPGQERFDLMLDVLAKRSCWSIYFGGLERSSNIW